MRKLALIILACGLPVEGIATAQLAGMADAGISYVRYDGFLGSAAAFLTPAVRWDGADGRAFFSARGTYLRFESGNRSLDGSLTGAWLAPLARQWRAELAVTGGASDYAGIASFAHGLGEARLHYASARRGAWMGASTGRASFGDGGRSVFVVSVGGWAVRQSATLLLSADRSFVGDTSYSDVRSSIRLYRGRILLDGTLGARFWSRGAGRGLYGEASAALPLRSWATLAVAGGRYPTDIISGSIAGRYVTLGLRLGRDPQRGSRGGPLAVSRPADSAPVRIELDDGDENGARAFIRAPGAVAVEIIADFTDWKPITLARGTGGAWVIPMRLARGLHRCNVRIDGGPWTVPGGTTRLADDYDGVVGVFVVP